MDVDAAVPHERHRVDRAAVDTHLEVQVAPGGRTRRAHPADLLTHRDELADADIRAAMQWRNEFMVDHSQLILACFDGSPGGTANCLKDAETQGKPVVNTYPKWAIMTGTTVNAPTVRTDGVLTTFEGQTLTVYPVADSAFHLGHTPDGAVLIHNDTLVHA